MLLEQTKKGLILSVKVTPQSRKNEVLLSNDNQLQVKITAAPEKNKANEAIIEILSTVFNVPKSCLEISKGHSSRYKKILLKNISLEYIEKHLKSLSKKELK